MADALQTLLLDDSDEDTSGQGNANGLPDNSVDLFAQQLAAINSIPAAQQQTAPGQAVPTQAAGMPAASPPPNKGTLIFDPAHVLASQQQKAAASRPSSADPSSAAGLANASAPRPAPQHSVPLPAHSGGMMYRPAANNGPVQPSAQPSQVAKCKQARQLVQAYKAARQAHERGQGDQSKPPPSQALFQTALQRLVGPDLAQEFNLLHSTSGQSQGKSAQSAQLPAQQLPGQQLRNNMSQQGNAMPRAAVSQPQLRVNAQQHPQAQVQLPGMVRPPASLGFPVASQGVVKQEPQGVMMQRQSSAQLLQHPQPLQNGQQQPGIRAQMPGLPSQQQLGGPQQQQGMQAAAPGQPQMQPVPGTAYAQAPAARPAAAKRPASGAAAAPAAKKVKQDENGNEQDVLFSAGVDEDAEQEALLGRAQPAGNRGPAPPDPRILNPHPLQAKVLEALRQYGLQGSHSTLQPYLNQAIWQHIEGILTQACKMASQRADLSRNQEGMQTTTDVRKALGDKARTEKERALAKQEAEKKALLEASKEKGDEDVQRKVKEVQKEELEKQNRAQTNAAIGSALGGGARWKNWGKRSAGTTVKAPGPEAALKPSSGSSLAAKAAAAAASKAAAAQTASAASALPGGNRALLPPSRMVTDGQIVGLKDVIAVMEQHPVYCKSDLLYKMYDRLDAP